MPMWPSHHNEEFFPEPEKFMPERFLKENANLIIPFTFRPFGGGNRGCIGQRFSMNVMLICMARLLSKFTFQTSSETNIEFNNGCFFILGFKDIILKLSERE